MAGEVKVIVETKNGKEEFYHAKSKDEKLSIEFLKKRLEKNGRNYTDEEVKLLSDYFYMMAEIEMQIASKEVEQNLIIQTQTNIDHEKSDSLHSGEYRRTG